MTSRVKSPSLSKMLNEITSYYGGGGPRIEIIWDFQVCNYSRYAYMLTINVARLGTPTMAYEGVGNSLYHALVDAYKLWRKNVLDRVAQEDE